MADLQRIKNKKRLRKSRSVRRATRGTAERPRLSVCRSSQYIYAQAIDDVTGRTVASASQLEKELRAECTGKTKTEAAKLVGALIGRRMKEKGVELAVFDRGWYRYHGRVKALADAAREAGIKF